MEKNSQTFEWKASLVNTYEGFIQQLIEMAPQVLGALGFLVFGWLVASVLRILVCKAMAGLDSVVRRLTKTTQQRQGIQQKSYAVIVSKIVFWSVFLFFITAAGNLLGWKVFAGWMDSLVRYLPNLVLGFLIILAGLVAGSAVHSAVYKASSRARLANAEILALSSQVIIILTTVIIGVEQMGVHVGFLTMLITVLAGILLAGACLAFGLGAQGLVANIIGAQFARKHCRIGETLNIAGTEGNILEITQTSIVLETKKGRAIIPAKLFQREVSSVEGGNV